MKMPQPQLVCFMFCDEVQMHNGKYCILGVFYRISPRVFPFASTCNIVMGWYGQQGVHNFHVAFKSPEGETLLMLPTYQFQLSVERPYVNVVLQSELSLAEPGTYWFAVYLDGELYGEYPLQVMVSTGIN